MIFNEFAGIDISYSKYTIRYIPTIDLRNPIGIANASRNLKTPP